MKTDKRSAGSAVYGLLFLLAVFFVWLFCLRRGMFGAKVDWISQHSVLPDYFRSQFYETWDLFLEFAANIGGGQNIYKFSYYGLLSPVILPAYLLPFVKMSDYMMAAQFVCLAASVLLFYRWLLGRGFEKKICFGVSVMFLLSGPMIFHSYNQIMFVNYMPFLCMGFLGVDRYFEELYKDTGAGGKKRQGGLLTVGVFLMIMTSFYFSIGGMLVLVLYGFHRYIKEREHLWLAADRKEPLCRQKAEICVFVKEGILFLRPFLTAVLMSGILLVPTAMAMSGRAGKNGGIDFSELFLPGLSVCRFFYTPYGMGLTTFAFTALVAMLFSRGWPEQVLAWGCAGVLMVPVFAWLLNGGLYVRDKVMIPFLPLMCYVTACYMDGIGGAGRDTGETGKLTPALQKTAAQKKERGRSLFFGMLPYLITFCVLCLHFARSGAGKCGRFVLADGALMLLCYGIYCIRRHVLILIAPPVLLLGIFGNVYHAEAAKYVDKGIYRKVTDPSVGSLAEKAAETEKGFYRTEQSGTEEENAANLNRIWDAGQYVSSIYSSLYNSEYQRFRKEFGTEEPYRNCLMQPAVKNPLFRRFMGVKYLIADRSFQKEGLPFGYTLKSTEGTWGLYEDPMVSPVAYATDQVMGEEAYKELGFPENQLSLLRAAVVEGEGNVPKIGSSGELVPVQVSLPREIDSRQAETVRIDILQLPGQPGGRADEAVNSEDGSLDQVLFLRFGVENLKPSRDVAVWAEGQRNKLTSRKHFYYNGNTAFTYGIPLRKGQRSIEMVFGEGHYRISDVQCFLGALPAQKEAERLYQSEFLPDKGRTKGNVIAGNIDVKNNGYFITTIPYDENFEISVDGELIKEEKVNTAFLGCRIEKGRHEVEIVYHAPGMAAGKIVSVFGLLLFLSVDLGWKRERVEGKGL